jgi:geranylgeranyl diphosphate synthase type II
LENPPSYSSTPDLSFLKEHAQAISDALKDFLPDPSKASRPELEKLYRMEWDYNLRGGKRMRAALCLLTNQMLGGSKEKALPTAVAVEVLHNFLLVHDDLEDQSDLRRGKPAFHKLYGDAHAINTGDALFIRVWGVLIENKRLLGATTSFKVLREFFRQCEQTAEGQAMEIDWIETKRLDLQEKDYFTLVEKKTANYTITTPMRLGAIIAGAPTKLVNSFDAPGLKLGTAFQIQDDVLNLLASEGEMGKEVGGDLYEGKRTLIVIHALAKAKGEDRKVLENVLVKPRSQKTKPEVEAALQVIHSTGSIQYSQGVAKKLAAQAKEQLEKRLSQVADSQAKADFFSIVDYAVERKY